MAYAHVVLLYAGLFGLLLVVLSFNMMKSWVRAVELGKQSDPDLRRAEALVSSFTDYVPIALFLIGVAEASGAPSSAIHMLGAGLVVARLMHAFGSNYSRSSDALRFFGAQLTYLVLTVASFSCLFFYAMPSLAGVL
jgi:uncharacterized protein